MEHQYLEVEKTDVYSHDTNLKKSMDEEHWLTSDDFKHRLLNVEALSHCLLERKREQKVRQEKAKVCRKQKREERKASTHSDTLKVKEILDSFAAKAKV